MKTELSHYDMLKNVISARENHQRGAKFVSCWLLVYDPLKDIIL